MAQFQQIFTEFNQNIRDYNPLSTKNDMLKQRLVRAGRYIQYYDQTIGNTLEKIERFSDDLHIIFEVFIVFNNETNTNNYTYPPVGDLIENVLELEQDAKDILQYIEALHNDMQTKFARFLSLLRGSGTLMTKKYGRAGIKIWIKQTLGLSPQSSELNNRLSFLKDDMEIILVLMNPFNR